MDESAFTHVCRHFKANCGAVRPLYVLVDGHYSHVASEALSLLIDDKIYPFILKSQDSENDQVCTHAG